MLSNLLLSLFVGSIVGAASGFLGSFMVLKRMSLVGDALSHVALPGMAIFLVARINPMIGAIIALTLSVLGIWYLERKTEIYSETLVGVFFTTSLALGVLITPEPELLEALFGSIEKITPLDGLLTILGSVFVLGAIYRISKDLILGVVSEELAGSLGVNVARINLVYFLMLGLIVALGVKFVGTLLTGALVVVPAAAAKNLAKSIRNFQLLSILIGIFSSSAGIFISYLSGLPTGPIVILVSCLIFTLSLFLRGK